MYLVSSMKRISLLIAHSDKEYSDLLGKGLSLKYPIFDVKVDSNIEANMNFDLILTDDWIKDNLRNEGKDKKHIVGVYEDQASDSDSYIYKYSGLREISSYLQILYAGHSGKSLLHNSTNVTKIVGFTAAAGGVGKTAVAIAVGKGLSSYRRYKVLILSFDEVDSIQFYYPNLNKGLTISDYLYYLFSQRESNKATFLDAFLYTDAYGLSYFRPSKGLNELLSLSEQELLFFLESIVKKQEYTYICIDFPLDTSEVSTLLLKTCQHIYLIDDGSAVSINKNEKILDHIVRINEEEIINSFKQIRNKWSDNIKLPAGVHALEYDINSFINRGSFIEMNLDRSFGLGVRKIVEEIRGYI